MDGKREQDAFLIIAHLLKRSNCDNTFLAFQKEVRSSLNLIDSVDAFVYEVNHGRWNVVLETILCFKLPVGKLIRLYEHIIFECVEAGHHDVAQTIFSKFDVMATSLKEDNYKKWLEIDKIIIRKSFNPKQVYAGGTKESARAEIAKELSSELIVNSGLGYINLLQRELTRSIQDREKKSGRDGVRQSKVLSSKYYLVHETQPDFIQHWNFVIVKLESIVEEEAGPEGQARAKEEIEAIVRAEVERNDRLHQDQYQKTLQVTLEAPVPNNAQSGNNSSAANSSASNSGVTLKALQQQLIFLQAQGKKELTQQQIMQNQEQVARIQQQIRALLQGIGDKSGSSPTNSDGEQQQAEIEAARKRKEKEEADRKLAEQQQQQQLEALEREKERARAQAQAELERREAEERAREERERLEAERRENERKENERRENERRENDRREEEARRTKALREENERREQERIENERRENERRENERRENERRENERRENERREQERIENERRENERREAERKAEEERKERERLAAEERKRQQQQQKEEEERRERERKEAAEREEAARKEKERLAREEQERQAQAQAQTAKATAEEPENDTTEFINQVAIEDRVVEWCQAFHAYEHAQPDPNFLSFAAGDCFRVILENSEELQGWRLVLDVQNRKGFIPGNYLKTISEDDYLQWERKFNDEKKKSDKLKQEKEQHEEDRKRAEEKKKQELEAARRKQAEQDKEKEKAEKEKAEKEKKRVNDMGLNTVDRRDRIKKTEDVADIRSNLPIAEAKYDYTHPDSTSTEFFSFKTGDKFSVLLNSPDLKGWTIVLNSKNEKGFVPGNYLTVAEVKSPRGKKGSDREEHSTSSSAKGRAGRKEAGKDKGKK